MSDEPASPLEDLRPSQAKAAEYCPSFLSQDSTSEAAERGTRLHLAVEKGNPDLAQTPDEPDPTEDIRQVNMCLEVKNYLRKQAGEGHTEHHEIPVHPKYTQPGTCDYIVLSQDGRRGWMADWKFGLWQVDDAEENLQGWLYAEGLFNRFDKLETLDVVFVQPRLDEVSTATFTRTLIPQLHERMEAILVRRLRPEEEREHNIGPACRFCGRTATCRAHLRVVQALASGRDGTKTEAVDLLPELPAQFHANQLSSPEDMSKALTLADFMASWAAAVKEHAKLRIEMDGWYIPGWTLKSRSGRREILDTQAAWDYLSTEYGLTEDQFREAAKISVPKLLDAVGSNAPRGQKKKVKQKVEGELMDRDILSLLPEVNYLAKE